MSKINKALSYLYYSLFLVTPLIMYSGTSELFEFNKMIFIYFITIAVLFLWLVKMIAIKKIILEKTFFDLPIGLFVASQILSTIFSLDRHTSFFGYYGRFNGGLLSIIAYVILFYGLVSNFSDFAEKFIEKLLKISLFSSVLVILWGLPGKFGYDLSCWLFMHKLGNSCWTDQFRPAERMFSTLGQPNWLGAYLAINFFIGLFFLLKNQNTKYFILNTLYLFLNFSSILFTRSRSALIPVFLGVLAFIFSLFLKDKKVLLPKLLKTLLFIILIPIILFQTGVDKFDKFITPSTYTNLISKNKLTQQYNNITIKQSDITESFDIRKIVWQGAMDLGLRYPLFGTGVETFAYSYYFVRPQAHNLTSEWDYLYNKAHNEYLNYFATTGFFGLGSYLIFIGSVSIYGFVYIKNQKSHLRQGYGGQAKIKNIYQNSKSKGFEILDLDLRFEFLHLSLIISWVTILITNFFGFSTTVINLYFYLIPALLICLSLQEKPVTNKTEYSFKAFDKKQKILFFITLLSTLYLLLSSFLYWFADTRYALAETASRSGDYQTAVKDYDLALKLRYEHVYEDKLSYTLANLAFLASYQKQDDLAKNLRKLADGYNLKTLNESPNNVLYWKTRAKNYYLFYQISLDPKDIETALVALDEASKLSPSDPKIDYSRALFYSLLNDDEKDFNQKELYKSLSIQAINQSIALKPNYREAYFLKGQLLKKFGEVIEAKKTWQYILDKIAPDDPETVNELKNL